MYMYLLNVFDQILENSVGFFHNCKLSIRNLFRLYLCSNVFHFSVFYENMAENSQTKTYYCKKIQNSSMTDLLCGEITE